VFLRVDLGELDASLVAGGDGPDLDLDGAEKVRESITSSSPAPGMQLTTFWGSFTNCQTRSMGASTCSLSTISIAISAFPNPLRRR
jgi:hypothetical protein